MKIISVNVGVPRRVTWRGKSVSTGIFHACGVAVGGTAYCWGANGTGQLGTGNNAGSQVPVPLADPIGGAVTWSSITVGGQHTCGVTTTGLAFCWGRGTGGQLGNGGTLAVNVPTLVTEP